MWKRHPPRSDRCRRSAWAMKTIWCGWCARVDALQVFPKAATTKSTSGGLQARRQYPQGRGRRKTARLISAKPMEDFVRKLPSKALHRRSPRRILAPSPGAGQAKISPQPCKQMAALRRTGRCLLRGREGRMPDDLKLRARESGWQSAGGALRGGVGGRCIMAAGLSAQF